MEGGGVCRRGCARPRGQPEQEFGGGRAQRSVGHWQAARAWNAGAEGPALGADCKVKASSVHDTSVVLRSGHVLHGDSKARRKRCC